MNENIFDKRRLKTFSNCKDLVKSMIGTRDGIIFYNEKFRLDLETTCYKASMYDDLQQENQSLKKANKILRENAEHNDKLVDDYWWENKNLKDRIEKAIEYIETHKRQDEFLELNEWGTRDLLEILGGKE